MNRVGDVSFALPKQAESDEARAAQGEFLNALGLRAETVR